MSLHHFSAKHIDEDCSSLSGDYTNELFYGCTFRKLNGLTLRKCFLNGSRFLTSKLRDALGFTLTLDCFSFRDVEYSPVLFDLLLCLITMTKGNDDKRVQLQAVVGPEYSNIMRVLGSIG